MNVWALSCVSHRTRKRRVYDLRALQIPCTKNYPLKTLVHMMALESSFPKTFRSKAHKNEKSTRLNMKSNAHTFAELHQTKLWRNDNDGVEDSCYRFNMKDVHRTTNVRHIVLHRMLTRLAFAMGCQSFVGL